MDKKTRDKLLKKNGISYDTYMQRVYRGWKPEIAATTPTIKQTGFLFGIYLDDKRVAHVRGTGAVAKFLTDAFHYRVSKGLVVGRANRRRYAPFSVGKYVIKTEETTC